MSRAPGGRALGERLVAAVIRCYPRAFRARFGAEMLTTFLDQRDAIVARHGPSAPDLASHLARHTARTIAGLLRALVAVRLQPHEPEPSPPSPAMRHLAADLRFALRALRASPGYVVVAVLTLALGIGANTAVFSVVDRVILSPLPYPAPERLVRVYQASTEDLAEKEFTTRYDMAELRDGVRAFSAVGVLYTYRETGADIRGPDGVPQRVTVLPVSADYFATLGATPLLGRTFTRDEERPDVRRVILSHALWSALTGGDPSVVGRTIDLNGWAYEVVGVMRPTFTDVVVGDVALWVPQNLERAGDNARWNSYLSVIARLRAGTSIEQAQAEVNALVARLREQFPDSHGKRQLRVVALHDDVVGESRSPLYLLTGAAGLVLLIACVNVANLALVRGEGHMRETAIRTALGARRSRLFAERLTESLTVAVAGGVAGSAVAYGGVKLLLAVSPQSLARVEDVRFDGRLLAFSLLVTVATGLLFGVAPAVRASRAQPSDALRDGARGNTGGRASGRVRGALVASQLSLAVMLLVGAGLLLRSFVARQRVDLGFDAARVATFEVNLPAARYATPEERVQFHAAYGARLRALPGVSRVGATSWLPANGAYHQWGLAYRDDRSERVRVPAQVRVIDGDFLETLGVPLLRGRTFGATDRMGTPVVALISRSLARRAFGERDPIGQSFRTGSEDCVVAGVVGDVANDAAGTDVQTVYLSHAQFAGDRSWALNYVVKAAVPPDRLVESARQALAAVDPALVLYQPRAMDAVLARHRARERFTLLLMATFAGVALTLAAIGVYGVLSYAVAQRTHEIGVRMALGARPGQVRALVVKQGLSVAGLGLGAGLVGAMALGGLLRSLIFGVGARDVTVLVSVTSLLIAAVMAAAYVPVRRATRVDPLRALRAD